jgi:UDPglucose--hexose-1-phosphate uridylyltransferase
MLPHRRFDPLAGEWVLVSPQRDRRPWQGLVEPPPARVHEPHSEDCPLCPGNRRAGAELNPDYTGTYVFDNDFPALLRAPAPALPAERLFRAEAVSGECRVLCFSPRHDLTLAQMDVRGIRAVVDTWAAQVEELSHHHAWVQVFENKGELMGCSNPHPHGQIWATKALPHRAAVEDERQRAHREEHGSNLLLDYAGAERERGERVVLTDDDWLVVVPFWAVWPFETMILPQRIVPHLNALTDAERDSLARVLQRLLRTYDRLFDVSFPYTMGWHGAPHAKDVPHWQLHAHVYPPLLRSASVRKFLVGYEMLAEAQRDMLPEESARRLREMASG